MYTFLFNKKAETDWVNNHMDKPDMIPLFKLGDRITLNQNTIRIHRDYSNFIIGRYTEIEIEKLIDIGELIIWDIAIEGVTNNIFYAFVDNTIYISQPALIGINYNNLYGKKQKLVYEDLKSFKNFNK